MNLNQIRAFVHISENHSFSQTARELYVTQPTVSASISSLESELGVRLFVRTAKGVDQTPEGKSIYLYARQIVENADAILRTLSESEEEAAQQPILIAASTIPTQYVLPDIMAELYRRNPKIQLRIQETDSLGVIQAIENHTVDLGFTGTAVERPGCQYTPIYTDELVVITPNTKHFRDIDRGMDSTEWVCREPMIVREDGSGTFQEAWNALKELGISKEDLNIAATISSPTAILQSVKNEVGISIISRLAADEYVRSGSMLAFPLKKGGCLRFIYLVQNNRYPLRESGKRLLRVVQDLYQISVK